MMSTRHNGKRSLGSIAQAIHAFGTEATDPFADGLRGRIELARSLGVGHAAIHNGTNHFLSTFRGQASILMSVHSVTPRIAKASQHQRSRCGPKRQPPESSQLAARPSEADFEPIHRIEIFFSLLRPSFPRDTGSPSKGRG